MRHAVFLSAFLSMARVGECARSNLARVEAQMEAADEQTQDSSIYGYFWPQVD